MKDGFAGTAIAGLAAMGIFNTLRQRRFQNGFTHCDVDDRLFVFYGDFIIHSKECPKIR
jgi:hypothetical protein